VPWLEYTSGGRRDIIAGQSRKNKTAVESEIVTNRLQELGYVQ